MPLVLVTSGFGRNERTRPADLAFGAVVTFGRTRAAVIGRHGTWKRALRLLISHVPVRVDPARGIDFQRSAEGITIHSAVLVRAKKSEG